MVLLAKSEMHTIDVRRGIENQVCQPTSSCETDFASSIIFGETGSEVSQHSLSHRRVGKTKPRQYQNWPREAVTSFASSHVRLFLRRCDRKAVKESLTQQESFWPGGKRAHLPENHCHTSSLLTRRVRPCGGDVSHTIGARESWRRKALMGDFRHFEWTRRFWSLGGAFFRD
jgi:hypothetical protein